MLLTKQSNSKRMNQIMKRFTDHYIPHSRCFVGGIRLTTPPEHSFGGDWTEKKLAAVKSYLQAYQIALKNQTFQTLYIDAFAGTGYRKNSSCDGFGLFSDLDKQETNKFHAGSARIALEIEPSFSQFIFIEQDQSKCQELELLKDVFPSKSSSILIINDEANQVLSRILKQKDWFNNRAVLFLDPYGMNVEWETIGKIAGTKAIDLWYLFPLGIGVNRLLVKDGEFPKGFDQKLDKVFGDTSWRDEFYKTITKNTLFGEVSEVKEKTATFPTIEAYILERLKSIFPGVAENPLTLYNSKNSPLYLLCFAVGNERGKNPALRMAKHILGKSNHVL